MYHCLIVTITSLYTISRIIQTGRVYVGYSKFAPFLNAPTLASRHHSWIFGAPHKRKQRWILCKGQNAPRYQRYWQQAAYLEHRYTNNQFADCNTCYHIGESNSRSDISQTQANNRRCSGARPRNIGVVYVRCATHEMLARRLKTHNEEIFHTEPVIVISFQIQARKRSSTTRAESPL